MIKEIHNLEMSKEDIPMQILPNPLTNYQDLNYYTPSIRTKLLYGLIILTFIIFGYRKWKTKNQHSKRIKNYQRLQIQQSIFQKMLFLGAEDLFIITKITTVWNHCTTCFMSGFKNHSFFF